MATIYKPLVQEEPTAAEARDIEAPQEEGGAATLSSPSSSESESAVHVRSRAKVKFSSKTLTVIGGLSAVVIVAVITLGITLPLVFLRSHRGGIADVVVINGVPSSVAIRGKEIIAVGETEEILKYVGTYTTTVDAKGGLVLPGFVDSHVHALQGSLALSGRVANVDGTRTEDDLVKAMMDYRALRPDDSTVVGMHAPYLDDLTRQHLDRVAASVPVFVLSYDLHTAWANTRLLEMAGLLNATSENVPKGADGLASGELIEVEGFSATLPFIGEAGVIIAHRLVYLPPDELLKLPLTGAVRSRIMEQLEDGLRHLASKGITSIHVMDGDREQLSLFDELEQKGALPVRVSMATTAYSKDLPTIGHVLINNRNGDSKAKVRCGTCKFFLDGVIDTATAYTTDPYPGTTNHGKPFWTSADFMAALKACDEAKMRVATHAIGDAAVRLALDSYAAVFKSEGKRDRRWSLEHNELVHKEDVGRFSKLGVVASMQPLHAEWDPEYLERIPNARLGDVMPWKTLLDAGTTMVWGSDWPVVDADVIPAIRALTDNRKPIAAGLPDQRVPLDAAQGGYTTRGAWLGFQESVLGKLKPGYLADIVVLDSPTIKEGTEPIYTICDGKITYDRPEADIAIINSVPYSVAISGQTILAVGDLDKVTTFYGPNTVVYDANGGLVLPGFHDNHIHPMLASLMTSGDVPVVSSATTEDEMVALLQKEFAKLPASEPGMVAMGGAYLPALTRHHLDRVSATKDVIVLAYDLHSAWANTPVLRKTGLLNASSEFVPLGPDGLSTGELHEAAGYSPVLRYMGTAGVMIAHKLMHLPKEQLDGLQIKGQLREKVLAILKKGVDLLASKGITSIHVMDGDYDQLSLYDELEATGKLPVRVTMATAIYPGDLPTIDSVIIKNRTDYNAKVRCGTCKFYLDGVLESMTANTIDPYPNTTDNHGKCMWDSSEWLTALKKCDENKLRVATHCVGDAAVRMALDSYQAVARHGEARSRRWSIEHIEIVHPADVSRFAKLGVVASMQPLHAATTQRPWAPDYVARFPVDRYPDAFAWDTLHDAGAILAWGSDWPVVDPDVLPGIMALTTNRVNFVPGLPDQRQKLDVALDGYTYRGAWLQFNEDNLGKLKRGYLADLVVLDQPNVTDTSAPLFTFCDGKITYNNQK